MVYGSTAIVLMVISVVACVLGLTFAGLYYLNKSVDRSTASGSTLSARDGVG
jgi:Na+/H+-dicarboxylate symporter